MFKTQAELKAHEEKELLKVLTDYRKKYKEFERSMINNNFKILEKEVKSLDSMNAKFAAEKNKFCKRMGFNNDTEAERQIEQLQIDWDAQKQPMLKEIEQLKSNCAELQA